jgi:hypothetical protein
VNSSAGGDGGTVTIIASDGGDGATAGGDGGSIVLTAGDAGSGGNANGGNKQAIGPQPEPTATSPSRSTARRPRPTMARRATGRSRPSSWHRPT